MSGQGALAAKVMEEGDGPGTVSPDAGLQQRSQQANELLLQGNALTEQGNFSRAIEFFKHAIALNPELADAYRHLGSLLAETGRIAEGFDYLMKVRVADMDAYRQFLGHGIARLPGVRETRTYVVIEKVKSSTLLPTEP